MSRRTQRQNAKMIDPVLEVQLSRTSAACFVGTLNKTYCSECATLNFRTKKETIRDLHSDAMSVSLYLSVWVAQHDP